MGDRGLGDLWSLAMWRYSQIAKWRCISYRPIAYRSISNVLLQMLGSALAADFITEGRSLILAGKPGRGKTHLAIAIAYRAIQNGFDAFFTLS